MALSFVEHCHAMPFLSHHAKIVITKTKIDDWTLEIARNPFSEGQTCKLRAVNNRAFYANGAVAFRFRQRWDLSEAVYRLDGAAPRHSRNDLPQLLALKVPIDRGGMDNASGGLVWIPYDRLVEANQVTIQPQPGRNLTNFRFRGLRSLHDIAIAKGCVPDSRFVER
ncbi:MAG: hypothetical protein K2X59_00355 [Sphingomonas sp.]|nr:hypothetical protein [Sphingomonas sp.]